MTQPILPDRGEAGPGCTDDLDILFAELSDAESTETYELTLGVSDTPVIYGIAIS